MAAAAALPAFLFPLYNPDLFWHLSAARWIIEHRIWPTQDFLSWTKAGALWMDFEWLAQLSFYGVWAAGGFLSLWLLKVGALAAAWRLLDLALVAAGATAPARALGLAAWACAMLGFSDIRPELFSVVLVSALLWRLEAWRSGRLSRPGREVAVWVVLFAAWSNLHAGFIAGWTVIGAYALGELAARRPRSATALAATFPAAVAATLVNPYGLGTHRVAWRHLAARGDLARFIAEWRPLSAANPLHWGLLVLLLACAGAAVAACVDRRDADRWPAGAAISAGYFGAAAMAHERAGALFAAAGVIFLITTAKGRLWLSARVIFGALGALLLYACWSAAHVDWRGPFTAKYVPRRAAAFVSSERPALSALRFDNVWEWGGYLGWELAPWFKVSCDGRYLFHDRLPILREAASAPERWSWFLDEEGAQAALMPDLDAMFPSIRRYPNGSTAQIARPWYLYYMPRERWALVYWDEQALLFVRRAAVSAGWLAAHEYRWARPKDDAAFRDALARGEIPAAAAIAEWSRHAHEVSLAPPISWTKP